MSHQSRTSVIAPCLLVVLQSVAFTMQAFAQSPEVVVHVDATAKPWTSLEMNSDPEMFRFAVVSDNAGGPRWGIFGEAMDKVNLMQPDFVMSIGDYIEGYEDTREGLERQWTRFLADVDKLEMPFFFVPGNHDIGRPLWAEIYKERFGVPYYHFVYKDVLFLCLCTNDGPENATGISQAQVDYVAKTLEENQNVRWTLVFQHKPLWNENGQEGWEKIQAMLKGRNCTVFAGHTHNYLGQEEDGISFVTLATTGGGSPLRGVAYGEFDEIAWVTMTGRGPRIANLLLDGILPKDVRTPAMVEELSLFQADRAVSVSPVLVNGVDFAEGTSHLTVKNPSDKPMRFKALMEVPAGCSVLPATVATVVPGEGEYTAELAITAESPIPMPQMQPVVLHWTASYDSMENKPSLELSGVSRIIVEAPVEIPVAGSTLTIDGSLDDWDDVPFEVTQPAQIYVNPEAWKGPSDTTYSFGVRRDSENLYVAVKVVDDEPCFKGWKYWEDFAMVWVDARASVEDDPKAGVFSVIVGPETSPEQAAEYQMGAVPDGVKASSRATDNGFTAEVAVPVAYLNEYQNGDWRRVRLNVSVSDFDEHDARDGVTILHWRPQWVGPGAYPNAGTFVKESGGEQQPTEEA